MELKPLNLIKSASYKVENVIALKIATSSYKTTASYDILIKNSNSPKYDFLLERGKISINGSLPDTKFLSLAEDYFSCVFPIHFLSQKGSFLVANFSEINERIIKKDKELRSVFSGDGIEYISASFLQKTNSEEKLQYFISNLNLMNALYFALRTAISNQTFHWNILPISNTSWKGNSAFENNLLEFSGEMQLDSEFTESVKQFALSNFIELDFGETSDFSSNLKHQTEYLNDTLKFKFSSTNISIRHDDFEYEEVFTLKSKTAN